MKAMRIVLFSMFCVTAVYVSATAGGRGTPPAAQSKYFGDEFAEAQRHLSATPAEEAPPTF